MDITPDTAFRVFALAPSELRPYLPRIFDRLRVPAEDDGVFVETYIVSRPVSMSQTNGGLILMQDAIHRKFDRRFSRGPGSGWNDLLAVCVGEGLVETLFSLVQHPRGDIEVAVHNAWTVIFSLSNLANLGQRRMLLKRVVSCNALEIRPRYASHENGVMHSR